VGIIRRLIGPTIVTLSSSDTGISCQPGQHFRKTIEAARDFEKVFYQIFPGMRQVLPHPGDRGGPQSSWTVCHTDEDIPREGGNMFGVEFLSLFASLTDDVLFPEDEEKEQAEVLRQEEPEMDKDDP
jgi:hypothetical protein